MKNETIGIKGALTIILKDKDGKIKEKRELKNLVVQAGTEFIASRMLGDSEVPMTAMGVGSGLTDARPSDVDLQLVINERVLLDSATASVNKVVYVCSFKDTFGEASISEAGIFNAPTGGTMLCRTVFPVINKQAADSISISWTITLTV